MVIEYGPPADTLSEFWDFPGILKETVVKKPSLDPVDPANWILFLDKRVEKVVVEQLQVFLEDSFVVDHFQSSFCPGYGMELVLVTSWINC